MTSEVSARALDPLFERRTTAQRLTIPRRRDFDGITADPGFEPQLHRNTGTSLDAVAISRQDG